MIMQVLVVTRKPSVVLLRVDSIGFTRTHTFMIITSM